MKIKINDKEHFWYETDLDLYTQDFLISIIGDLLEKNKISKQNFDDLYNESVKEKERLELIISKLKGESNDK